MSSLLLKLMFPHSEVWLEWRFIKEAFHFYKLTTLYNASIRMMTWRKCNILYCVRIM